MTQSRNVTKRGPGRPAFAPQNRLAGEAVSFRLPLGMMDRVRALANRDGESAAAVIRAAIEAEIKRREG